MLALDREPPILIQLIRGSVLRRDWIRTNDRPVRLSPSQRSIQLSYAAAAPSFYTIPAKGASE